MNIIKYVYILIILCHLLFNFSSNAYHCINGHHNCYTDNEKHTSQILIFQPGEKEYVETNKYDEGKETEYLRPLNNFKIIKDVKHCLWGSKDWDEECQNAAIEYAYGPKWKDFQALTIQFIRAVQDKEYDKAFALTTPDAIYFNYVSSVSDIPKCPICSRLGRLNKSNLRRIYIWGNNYDIRESAPQKKIKISKNLNVEQLRKHLVHINPDQLRFLMVDITSTHTYSIVVSYKEEMRKDI